MPAKAKRRRNRKKGPGQFKGRKAKLCAKNTELIRAAQCALEEKCELEGKRTELARENTLLKK